MQGMSALILYFLQDECSFVSLRDVERAMIVFKYFCTKLPDIINSQSATEVECLIFLTNTCSCITSAFCSVVFSQEPPSDLSNATRSLILAVSVCYHARLQDRAEYEQGVAAQFTGPITLSRGAAQFCKEIKWYRTCMTILVLKIRF